MKKFNKEKALRKLSKRNNKSIKSFSIVASVALLIGTIIYFSFARYEDTITFNLIEGTIASQNSTNYIADQIKNLKTNGATDLEYDGTSTLGELGTEDNNLRYIGSNPNNYIYFNCSTTDENEMNDTTCEKWRIIGVMNNIEDENGNKSSRVKIMRDESLGVYSWDTSSGVDGWFGDGYNQWGPSTYDNGDPYEGADLMRELNTDYLGNITVGTDGKWYDHEHGSKNADMPTNTLSTSAQSMIETVKWNLGSPSNNEGTFDSDWQNTVTPITSYKRERSIYHGNTAGWSYADPDSVIRTTSWFGKVALIYPSDYGYSTSGGSTTSRATCINTSMGIWDNNSDCYSGSWIPNDTFQWLLSPFAYNANYYAGGIHSEGQIAVGCVAYGYYVRPSVYLQNNILISSGDGSSSNPYKIVIE